MEYVSCTLYVPCTKNQEEHHNSSQLRYEGCKSCLIQNTGWASCSLSEESLSQSLCSATLLNHRAEYVIFSCSHEDLISYALEVHHVLSYGKSQKQTRSCKNFMSLVHRYKQNKYDKRKLCVTCSLVQAKQI